MAVSRPTRQQAGKTRIGVHRRGESTAGDRESTRRSSASLSGWQIPPLRAEFRRRSRQTRTAPMSVG